MTDRPPVPAPSPATASNWMEWTTADFSPERMAETIAVLPIAAVEQHGPHLPLGTDTFIMEGYLARARGLLADGARVLFLPVQAIGLSDEHGAFPGTLTTSAETLIRLVREIGGSVARAGIRKLLVVNSHGGNSSVIDIASRQLRTELGLVVVTTSWSRLGYPAGLFAEAEIRHGIHGGEIETSLMLAFRPDLVRMAEARNFVSRAATMESEFAVLRADRPAGFAWMSQDLHPSGAMGDARTASAAKGEAAASHGAEAFARLIADVAAFELDGGEEG